MKPLVFVSHIHEHENLAKAIQREISRLLLNGVDFFVSSDRVSLIGGDLWLPKIETAISNAAIVLVICSKDSVLRPWVNFEAGGAWMAKKRVLPLCCGGLQPSELPQPLASRHAYSITDPENLSDLITLIAREAGLDSPDFPAGDLATLLADSLAAPTADPSQDWEKVDLRAYPKTIRLTLKLTASGSFDAEHNYDVLDNARTRVYEERDVIESELRAFLTERFKVRNVPLSYRGVKFPVGSISTETKEDLNGSGYDSTVWCEAVIEVDWRELALLQEIRNSQALKCAATKTIGFLYRVPMDFLGFVDDLSNRGVPIKRLGVGKLILGELDVVGPGVAIIASGDTVEIRLPSYEVNELDLRTTFEQLFNYLKIGDFLKFPESLDEHRTD